MLEQFTDFDQLILVQQGKYVFLFLDSYLYQQIGLVGYLKLATNHE